MAVKTATSMCPLYTRSLQPPPAFVSKLYQADPSEAVGRRKSIRKLIEPQSGRKSSMYFPVLAGKQERKGYKLIRPYSISKENISVVN